MDDRGPIRYAAALESVDDMDVTHSTLPDGPLTRGLDLRISKL